ncbi:ABC transporter permease [Parabacteroides sp. PF5-9]|uniref:ABC transporter permease n=1 Tax=Parabacteroides sp. PF5-9 TaxID=1742404 RepID=UPI00247521C1|nr:ABC transporter permease [Parabacteroides sp. PF5-9]MDH6358485.1 putative ABC transport system permease protein [Parabacteroides sp. PF5-9]
MKFRELTHKNIRYYTRYYKLVAAAVLITVAVIVGSLVVGDSVRMTLVQRVTERLGDTETIIFSRNAFMEEELAANALFVGSSRAILLTNGFISSNGKLVPVFVWGTDDLSISSGKVKVNRALYKELGQDNGDLVLRLPATGLIPSGSLFVTENYTTSLRLSFDGIVEVEEGGNISMKNEQVIPFNVFVDRRELAEVQEVKGKINLILSPNEINTADLGKVWNYSSSGLSVRQRDGFTEIISDRVFLQEEVVDHIIQANTAPNRLFSYLANAIERDDRTIPYSFVSAVDRYKDEELQADQVILSDYSARRLHVKVGDQIRLTYYTAHDLKTLRTDSLRLTVARIVPLTELQEDPTLSAEFPGLSDVERCTDWDSDLPIEMDKIKEEDENYWELYGSTPKAIISYKAVANDWSNEYGTATAIRVSDAIPDLSGLRAEMFGIQLIYPREAGIYAARNGVDFSSLFLALGFFIIVSAILLMLVPLSEMLYQRRNEIDLLKALGFTRKRIVRMLWQESAPVVLFSSVAGVIAGLLYTVLIMWLLGSVWKGATHTDGFSVYPGILTILVGFLVGIGLSLGLLRRTIIRSLKKKEQRLGKKKYSLRTKKGIAVLSGFVAIGIILVNLFFIQSVTLFVLVGIILMGTAAIWGDYVICRNGMQRQGRLTSSKLIWAPLYINKKQAMLSFFALATGVFIVFSVGLNRKGFADSSQLRTGTGGYTLWCESTVPVYHNMATQAGRERLSLTALSTETTILQCLRYNADDASCLNLNKVTTPTVLGVDMQALTESDFQIELSLYPLEREAVFDRMQQKTDSVYPALVDATVLTWSLVMNLGDTLWYEGDGGKRVGIQLIGTLSNSVFQGHIMIDRTLFREIWEETTGCEVFLLKTAEDEKEEVKTLLSQALNEYGVNVSTTNDRLKQFNTVTDTYLTIFLTLGGLGLLIGIVSFIIVIRKNLAMRRKEIELYQTLGFTNNRIEETLYRENLLVPLYAILTGVISALVGVSISFMNTSLWVWLLALLFAIFFVICVIVFVRKSVKESVQSSAFKIQS